MTTTDFKQAISYLRSKVINVLIHQCFSVFEKEYENIITDKGKDLNGNASVLDPVVCEIIVRMFMPTNGCRVYNPFGGGVQMGFVAGGCGYEEPSFCEIVEVN